MHRDSARRQIQPKVEVWFDRDTTECESTVILILQINDKLIDTWRSVNQSSDIHALKKRWRNMLNFTQNTDTQSFHRSFHSSAKLESSSAESLVK